MSLKTDIALCTLAELKTFLDVSDTTDDARLELVINAVSQFLNQRTNRHLLLQATITEFHDGDGSDTLYLRNYPVTTAVGSLDIKVDTDSPRAWGAATAIDTDSLVLDADLGMVRYLDGTFAAGPQTVRAIYAAGYGQTGTLQEDAADLFRAALDLCGWIWNVEADKIRRAVTLSVQGISMSLTRDKAMSAYVEQVAKNYRRPSYRHRHANVSPANQYFRNL